MQITYLFKDAALIPHLSYKNMPRLQYDGAGIGPANVLFFAEPIISMILMKKVCQQMRKLTSIIFVRICLPFSGLLLISACGPSGPGPEIHDSKYVALDAEGQQLPADVAGPCVLDQFTGLVWEVKSREEGLHHRDNTYTWFDPDEDASGELDYRGKPDGGQCAGSACDTSALVATVNQATHCGFDDWRIPTKDELGSISDPRKTSSPPSINTVYFPHTQPGEYWSANDYQFHWNSAWLWSFANGLDRVEWKYSPRYVRLVRGVPLHLERVED